MVNIPDARRPSRRAGPGRVILIVAGVLVAAVALTAGWLFLGPRVFPNLGEDALRREALAVAEAVDGVDVEVVDDDKGFRVNFAAEAPPGPEFIAAMDNLDAELARRGWLDLAKPQIIDAAIYSYRVKLVGGRISYVTAVAGMEPVTPDEMPDTVAAGVQFSFESW